MLLRPTTVDEILAGSAEHDLPRNTDRRPCVVAKWRLLFIRVVKDDGDGRLGDTRLTTLVDQILGVGEQFRRSQSAGIPGLKVPASSARALSTCW